MIQCRPVDACVVSLAALLLAVPCALGDGPLPTTRELLAITAPPADVVARLGLSPVYAQHCTVGDLSIVATKAVPPAALREAAWLIEQMLGRRTDVLAALNANHVRFVVMNHDQFTTDVPEHSDLTPKDYWDRRARGLGATRIRPAVSCGAENLLGYPGDPYSTESILIHEFGHAIHEQGLSTLDATFDDRLKSAFQQAMDAGLWRDKYAATNRNEYWAEGVQSWFDTNRENDHDHNHVNTREELREYDAGLAALLEETFGEGDWRYSRPETRRHLPHLTGWDPEHQPRFEWPEPLREAPRKR